MSTPNQKKDWQKKLSKISGWEQAVSDSKTLGGALPAGSYIAKINSAELTESQNGRPQIAIKGEVIDHEEFEGTEFMTFPGLEGNSLKFTLRMLANLGYELEGDDPSQLISIVEELNSSEKEVKIKSDGNFINIIGSNEENVEVESENEEEEVVEEESEEDNEVEEDESSEEETEDENDRKDSDSEISEGNTVSWKEGSKTKTGEVIEVLEDKNVARIETSEGKIIRVEIDKLTVTKKEKEDASEEETEDIEDEEEVEEKPKKSSVKKVQVKKSAKKRK
jgi:hypothetical protein